MRGTGTLHANVDFHTRLRETKTQPVFEAGLRMTWMAHCDQHWSSARPPAQSKAQAISPSRCARPSQFNSHGLQNCIASVYTRIVSLDGHIGRGYPARFRVDTFSLVRRWGILMGRYVCVEFAFDVAALRRPPCRPPLFNERSDRSGRPKTKYFPATRIIAPALKRGGGQKELRPIA